jgi:predicted nucleotidyltransferase
MTLHFETRPEWLAWLADWAAGTEEVVALHLFGSRASGARRPKAVAPPLPDLDVAYEVAGATEQERFAASFDVGAGTAAIDVFHRFGVPLDLEFMDGDATPRISRFVATDGVCIWRRRVRPDDV